MLLLPTSLDQTDSHDPEVISIRLPVDIKAKKECGKWCGKGSAKLPGQRVEQRGCWTGLAEDACFLEEALVCLHSPAWLAESSEKKRPVHLPSEISGGEMLSANAQSSLQIAHQLRCLL